MTTNPLSTLMIGDLKKAVALRQRIDALRDELDRLVRVAPSSRGGGNQMRRKRLATRNTAVKPERHEAQRASKRRKLSRAARARLSTLAKARWAKAKASGKSRL
jgi:hypothetical protein